MGPRIGVVGLRRGGGFVNVLAALPGCELAAICDQDAATLARAAEPLTDVQTYQRYEDMLEQARLDLVVVATPVALHVPLAIAAMERGVGVISEVPAADSMDQCRQLAEAVERTGAFYFLAENMNYYAYFEAWQRLIDDGRIGDVYYAEAEYNHDCRSLHHDAAGRPTWRANYPPIRYCTHSLGPLLKLTGDRVRQVTGFMPERRTDPSLDKPDVEVAMMLTEQGACYKIMCAFSITRKPAFHYHSVYGTKGCLETSRRPGKPQLAFLADVPHLHDMIELPLSREHTGLSAAASRGGHGTAEWVMLKDCVDAYNAGRPSPIDVYAALDMSTPGLLAHESAMGGNTPLTVPDFRPRG